MTEQVSKMQPLTLARARVLTADPRRARVFDQIMHAMSRAEIDAAWAAQRAWLRENPDDFGMLDAGERLANLEEWLVGDMSDVAGDMTEVDSHAPAERPRGEASP